MKDKKPNLPNSHPYFHLLKSIDEFFFNAFKNFHNNGLFMPAFPVKTYETNTEYIIEAQLPGIKKERILLDIYQNYVRIAVKNEELLEEKNDKTKMVSHHHTLQVSEQIVSIPFHIKETDAKATFENGLLQIRFPNNRKTINIE